MKNLGEITSSNEIEFFGSKRKIEFSSDASEKKACLNHKEAYIIGLLTKPIFYSPKKIVFLVRSMEDKEYETLTRQLITEVFQTQRIPVEVAIRKGQLGYAWIVIKGKGASRAMDLVASLFPNNACLKLKMEPLKGYIAGILDAHLSKPLYRGGPVVTFLKDECSSKRFLNSILLLLDSQVVETSCITGQSPTFIETSVNLASDIPVKNPMWQNTKEAKALSLFSKIRSVSSVITQPTVITFDEQGFPP